MVSKPKTLFVAGVVVGINQYNLNSKIVIITTDANNISFSIRSTDRFYKEIKVGKRYLIVFLSGDPSKIISLWNNPSKDRILKISYEIEKYGTIIQKGRCH